MSVKNLAGHRTVNAFVRSKIEKLNNMSHTFESLFEMMFSERDNIMYEYSEGYRLVKVSYGEVFDSILSKSSYLKTKLSGLPHNSVIGIYLDNSLSFIEYFWAVIVCGYSPLLINTRLDYDTLQDALQTCEVKAVISKGRIFDHTDYIEALDTVDEKTYDLSSHFGQNVLFMSSGTSANIKICIYTAEQFFCQIQDSVRIIISCPKIKRHYKGELKQLALLPFYHVFGMIAVYLWFGFFSRTFVQLDNLMPDTVRNTVVRHDVTHIFAVPLFWEKTYDTAIRTIKSRGEKTYRHFLKGLEVYRKLSFIPFVQAVFSKIAFREIRENMFGNSISFMISGGSAIRHEVIEFFNAIGYRLADGYGLTEAGITSVELSDRSSAVTGSFIGKPLSSVQYKIVDDVLHIKGRSVSEYIIENGIKHRNDDWYNTNDLCECVNGHYRVLGRGDDAIILSNGENINPESLESKLYSDGIERLVIVPPGHLIVQYNSSLNESELSVIRSRLSEKIDEAGLRSSLSGMTFTSVPLLKDSEFKLNRKRIQKDFIAGAFSKSADYTGISDEKTETIKSVFSAVLNKDISSIPDTADFFTELGGSSLDYLEMISMLDELGYDTSELVFSNSGIAISADYLSKVQKRDS